MERSTRRALGIGAIVALLVVPVLFASPLARLWETCLQLMRPTAAGAVQHQPSAMQSAIDRTLLPEGRTSLPEARTRVPTRWPN